MRLAAGSTTHSEARPIRKFLSAILAVALLLPILAVTPVLATHWVEAPCSNSNEPNGNYHVWVGRTINGVGAGSSYFTRASGRTTVRDLKSCTATTAPPAGSFVLPANVFGTNGSPYAYQLGYGIKSDGVENFYYVHSTNGNPVATKIANPVPVKGRQYEFTIYRRSTGRVSYEIKDVAANQFVWTYYPTTGWSGTLDELWWGYEVFNGMAIHGHESGDADTKMSRMTYSTDSVPATIFVSDLDCTQIAKNFDWDSPYGNTCSGNPGASRIGTTYTTQFLNDTFDVTTHDDGY